MTNNDFALNLREKGMKVEGEWWIVWTSGLRYHIRHKHKHKHEHEKWLFIALQGVKVGSNSGYGGVRDNNHYEGWKIWRCEMCQTQVPDALLGMLSMARWEEEECGL